MTRWSPAARFDMVMEMLAGFPIYCECKSDCDVVIGRGSPLISDEQAKELLTAPDLAAIATEKGRMK